MAVVGEGDEAGVEFVWLDSVGAIEGESNEGVFDVNKEHGEEDGPNGGLLLVRAPDADAGEVESAEVPVTVFSVPVLDRDEVRERATPIVVITVAALKNIRAPFPLV